MTFNACQRYAVLHILVHKHVQHIFVLCHGLVISLPLGIRGGFALIARHMLHQKAWKRMVICSLISSSWNLGLFGFRKHFWFLFLIFSFNYKNAILFSLYFLFWKFCTEDSFSHCSLYNTLNIGNNVKIWKSISWVLKRKKKGGFLVISRVCL